MSLATESLLEQIESPSHPIADCKHGSFFVVDDPDDEAAKSLRKYGEYAEDKINFCLQLFRPGNNIIDVGAGIGSAVIPLAKAVQPGGVVVAFEPNDKQRRVLYKNLSHNEIRNVLVGDINCVLPEKIQLIRLDVPNSLEVLKTCVKTIKRTLPFIYIRNDFPENSEEMVALLVDLGYRLYWHRAFKFHAGNHFGSNINIFGTGMSIMILGVPDDGNDYKIGMLDEVGDIRKDDAMFDREIARYAGYVLKHPDDLNARNLMAHYCNLMQYEDRATAAVDENLRRNPDYLPARSVKGIMALQRGRWAEGWEAYELRYHGKTEMFGGNRTHPCPKWNGCKTEEPVLIWAEQGFGDNIMFSRFFPAVLERAPNAIFEVPPELFELFDDPRSRLALGLPETGQLFRMRRALPPYAAHCASGSLPHILEITSDAQIRTPRPYLFVDDMLIANWRGDGNFPLLLSDRFRGTAGPVLAGAKIGVCFRGSPTSERPFTRDLPDEFAARLIEAAGAIFNLSQTGQFESFAATAAAIEALDLVITVNTSVAHLAGALGKECWLLLSYDPDWRWGLKGETTIWYDSIKIFRQPKFRDWDSVIDRVIAELDFVPFREPTRTLQ